MTIWTADEPATPVAAAANQIRNRLSAAIETSRRALEVTVMLVKKHGKQEIAAELGEADATDMQRVYAILKAGLGEIGPALVIEDLPE